MRTLAASRRGSWGTDLRGYLGARESVSVLGRWKVVLFRTLWALCELTCCRKETGRQTMRALTRLKVRWLLTPRRVALAAADACLLGLLGLPLPTRFHH